MRKPSHGHAFVRGLEEYGDSAYNIAWTGRGAAEPYFETVEW